MITTYQFNLMKDRIASLHAAGKYPSNKVVARTFTKTHLNNEWNDARIVIMSQLGIPVMETGSRSQKPTKSQK